MRCSYCGKNNVENAEFCENCKEPFVIKKKETINAAKVDNQVSVVTIYAFIIMFSGFIALIIGVINKSWLLMLGSLFIFFQAGVFFSIDSRLAKIEDNDRINGNRLITIEKKLRD